MILNSPGTISPLFIHGPTGVGKSHLLEGIWTAMRRGPEKRRCVYLTAEQFTSYFLESLHGRGLPSFRRRYRDLDILIIEDVQFLIGKTATITEFQYTVDALLREGRQLVLSADRNPAALSKLGTEITTRLAGGLVTYLPPPDRQLRIDILDRMAQERNLQIGGDVLGMIADHLTEDIRVMSGALNRLQAASLALGERITMNLATKTLEELFMSSCCTVQLDDIQRVVCDVFGVDSRDLRSNCRARQMTYPRMLAMWLARKHTRAVLSEIGEYFGNRSHSTVISAEKRVNGWMNDGLIVRLPDCDCRVEEAVRRIETKLRAS
jgi:chromosomal replication initiator protein